MLSLSSNFLLHEISRKKESIIPKRYAWKLLCSSNKLLVTHGENYYFIEKIIMSHNAKYGNLKSWVVKEEETFRRKYSADTPTDTAFVDFGCASSSSQSKKDGVIEVDGFGEVFVKFSFNKFRINEAKICLNCKETHFNWFF